MNVVGPGGARSGSLVSPLPPRPWPLPAWPPRSSAPCPRARSPKGPCAANLHTFAPLRSRTESPGPKTFSLGFPSARPGTSAGRCACCPSIDMLAKRQLPRRRRAVASASKVPPSKSRSALVVLHHLGGFLRSASCGLVASRCRSWGSPRFRAPRPVEDRDGAALSRGAGPYPSKKSPPTAVPRHRVRCPPAVPSRSPPRLAWSRCRFLVCRGGRIGSASFEALLRRSGLVSVPRRCRRGGPAPSWALFPFMALLVAGDPVSCREVSCAVPEGTAQQTSSVRAIEADDPKTAALWRGSGRRPKSLPVPDPVGSLRGFTARVVHDTAARPLPGGGEESSNQANLARRPSMPSKSVRS